MKTWWRNLTGLFSSLWRLRPQLRGGRRLAAVVGATALLSALLEGLGVGLLVPLLSLLLGGEGATPMRPIRWVQSWLPGHGASFYVLTFCGLVLAAIAGKNLVLYASQVLAARLRARIEVNLRDALYRHLLGADLATFELRPAGEWSGVFLTETHRTILTLDTLLMLGQRGCMALFYLVALCVISWPLTVGVLGLGVALGGVVASLVRRLHRRGRDLTQANRDFSQALHETLGGLRAIRAHHAEAAQQARFHQVSVAQARVEEQSVRLHGLLAPLAETVAVAGGMAIVGLAYTWLVRPQLMLGSHLMGFGFVLLRLLPLLNHAYALQGQLFYYAGGLREVEASLQTPQSPAHPFGGAVLGPIRQGIVFDQVDYRYPSGTRALSGVSWVLPAGRTVALVGDSGSGKSTLIGLLLRFRSPTGGRILVDGADYWSFTAESWHRAVAVVEQEAFVFHDSVRANVALGLPSATDDAVRRALDVAQLADVVAALPHGWDTVIGERGSTLSGGQRQRLALARALVREPDLLVLDEATSALDPLSEAQLQRALAEAKARRTVLVVAHRLSTIRQADWIVVLRAGRVSEQGTWDQLGALHGWFAQVLQTEGAALAPQAIAQFRPAPAGA